MTPSPAIPLIDVSLPVIGATDGTGTLALTLPMLDAPSNLAGLAGLVCGARYLTKNAYRLVGVVTSVLSELRAPMARR